MKIFNQAMLARAVLETIDTTRVSLCKSFKGKILSKVLLFRRQHN
jgi:hypothetical protein